MTDPEAVLLTGEQGRHSDRQDEAHQERGRHAASPDATGVVDTASDRGSLDIRSRVVKRLAERSALDTPGVRAHAGGLDRITGRDYPRSRAVTSADRVRVWLEIAVVWPAPLAEVARQVQRNVAVALGDYAGLRVDGVDVVVAQVLIDESPTRSIE